MPKLVDHDARRREIVHATWRLIARQGPEAATMRQIAQEVGVANGAIGHYFRNKNELLEAAYLYVYDQTNERIEESTTGRTGREALRQFCMEILPNDETKLLEAKIVLSFWPRAVTEPRMAQIHEQTMVRWRAEMMALLAGGRRDGSVSAPADSDEIFVETLLSMLTGLQSLAVLSPTADYAQTQIRMLDTLLATLG